MHDTTDDTIPAGPDTCPAWCTDPRPHPWHQDGNGWQRLHSAKYGRAALTK